VKNSTIAAAIEKGAAKTVKNTDRKVDRSTIRTQYKSGIRQFRVSEHGETVKVDTVPGISIGSQCCAGKPRRGRNREAAVEAEAV
jgi:hypothetical protein